MRTITAFRTAGAVAAVAVGLAVLPATTASAVPAGPGNGVCESGEFCLYEHADQNSGKRGWVVDRNTYAKKVRSGASSWRNRSNHDWWLYRQTDCKGSRSGPYKNGRGNLSGGIHDKVASMARTGHISNCQK